MKMMYSVPHYYHSSRTAYSERKALIKQEPVDLFDAETPMDMSPTDTNHRPNVSLHTSSDNDNIGYQNLHFGLSCVPVQQDFSEHRIENTVEKEHLTLEPSTDNIISLSSVPSSGVKDFQTNFSRINRIPEILTKSGRNFDSHNVGLAIITAHQRARREFVPDNKKDNSYWCKRLKNNDSARRSRVKRKALEKILETRLLELEKENLELKHEVASLRRRCGEETASSSHSYSSSSPTHSSTSTINLPSSSQNAKVEVVSRDSGSGNVYPCDNSHQTSDICARANVNLKLEDTDVDKINFVNNNKNDYRGNIKTFNSQPFSYGVTNDGSTVAELQTDLMGALDLTIDNSNRSTPTWESSSSESDNNCCLRRYSFMSSESSSQEDNNNNSNQSIKVFPLKCRWKKEMHANYITVPERLK